MDAKFLASIFAAPPKILGRQLKPFCCGHAATLAAVNSPFLSDGKVTPEELIVAVWVCSQTYEDGKSRFREEPVAIESECKAWGKSVGQWNFEAANALFQIYLSEHTRAPDRWKNKEAKKGKAPWPLTIVTSLMQELNISLSEAWNMPLQEALWYYAAIAESKGDDSLISEEERQRLEFSRKHRAVQS